MLSITLRRGRTLAKLLAVAKYLEEGRAMENHKEIIEDHYTYGSLVTPSQWIGSAAPELGLFGPVRFEDHLCTLQGCDPRTGKALVQKAGLNRRYAWDLTLSTPKSLSILWAIAEPELRKMIEMAHDLAVQRTILEFIENKLLLGRRGSADERTLTYVKVALLVAMFRHGSSRELDPQLHTHALLQALGLRVDRTWGAIDAKELFEWKLALGAIYRAELAAEIRKLGFRIEPDREFWRVVGIPQELETVFSKRRAQIESVLMAKGLYGGKASEIAALDTRREKNVLAASLLHEEWRMISAEHGLTPEIINNLRNMGINQEENSLPLEREKIIRSLTKKGVFQEKDLCFIVATGCSWIGRGIDEINREVSGLLNDPEIIVLPGKSKRVYYSTKMILSLEEEIMLKARDGKEDTRHLLPDSLVSAEIARLQLFQGIFLPKNLQKAINHLTTRPGRVQLLLVKEVLEKSLVLQVVRQAYELHGSEVIDCHLQGKKTEVPGQNLGIPSQPLLGLLREIKGYVRKDGTRVPPTRALTDKTVVIVSEATRNEIRLLVQLMRETEKAGSKVILIGNEQQIPRVFRGIFFKSLQREVGFISLEERLTPTPSWHSELSREILAQELKTELQKSLDAGMIFVAQNHEESIQKTLEYWSMRFNPDSPERSCITAYRQLDVLELNGRVRRDFQRKGRLYGPIREVSITDQEGKLEENREFQVGDRILFQKGIQELGIMEGEAGTLKMIHLSQDRRECSFVVMLDKGKEIRFDPRDYPQIDYAYALPIRGSQNRSVEFSSNLLTGMDLNDFPAYFGHRHKGYLFVLTEDQIDSFLLAQGLNLPPTGRMIESVLTLAKDHAIFLPTEWEADFETCRSLLELHAKLLPDDGIIKKNHDYGLEKLQAIVTPSREREKTNILNFFMTNKGEMTHEKVIERKIEDPLKKERVLEKSKTQETSKEKKREQELEQGLGFGLGFDA